MTAITAFQNEYRFLSNFWPCYMEWEGLIYPTLEHAYVASKVSSQSIRLSIQSCATPGDAKEYLAKNHIEPENWTEERKLRMMEALLLIKFGGKEPLLTRALLATANAELIEGNDWNDTFWGICNHIGSNHLGKLLMKVRNDLLKEKTLIEQRVQTLNSHQQLAHELGISRVILYEKMIAFGISQSKYLGYQ